MSESIDDLKKKITRQQDVINGLERILRLNEEELANASEIIQMYEQISEFSRREQIDARDALRANEEVTNLSADELGKAFGRIKELEAANKKLREETERLRR